jgi:hypothetical protein
MVTVPPFFTAVGLLELVDGDELGVDELLGDELLPQAASTTTSATARRPTSADLDFLDMRLLLEGLRVVGM